MAQKVQPRLVLVLRAAIVFIGIGVLAFMLWAPHLEGRNVDATTFEIYFKDPFLAYVYVGSIPFFLALYQAFGLLGQLRRNGGFSQGTVDALHAIKRCAIALIGFVAGALVFIIGFGGADDRPQGIVMGLFMILCSGAVAFAAAKFARKVQNELRPPEGSRRP